VFTFHAQIRNKLLANVYFAHPYSLEERGLNQNAKGLLRPYFPNKTDFKTITQMEKEER
jgi:IS30 family transposase